jgi:hypothetical protein
MSERGAEADTLASWVSPDYTPARSRTEGLFEVSPDHHQMKRQGASETTVTVAHSALNEAADAENAASRGLGASLARGDGHASLLGQHQALQRCTAAKVNAEQVLEDRSSEDRLFLSLEPPETPNRLQSAGVKCWRY